MLRLLVAAFDQERTSSKMGLTARHLVQHSRENLEPAAAMEVVVAMAVEAADLDLQSPIDSESTVATVV